MVSEMGRSLLITGGAGYLGSHILHRLSTLIHFDLKIAELYERIDVIDDLSTGFLEALPLQVLTAQEDSIFHFYKIDLRDTGGCQAFFSNRYYDTVLHLAGKLNVAESVSSPEFYYLSNVIVLQNILKNLRSRQKTNFVFSSTAAVYGNSKNFIPLTEDSPLNPISPYGYAKLECENMLAEFEATNANFKFVVLRYFNIAGASDNLINGQRTANAYQLIHVASKVALRLLPALHIYGDKRKTKDGTCIRDYIHIEDIVDLHFLAMDYLENVSHSRVLNCGYEKETSVKDVIETFERLSGERLNSIISSNRPGDPDYAVASNQRIIKEFGWSPKRNDIVKVCKSALNWEQKYSLAKSV